MKSPQLFPSEQLKAKQVSGPISIGIPPLVGSVISGGWDEGDLRVLNLDTLRQLWRYGEAVQPIGKVDTRNTLSVTVPITAALNESFTGALTVPAGELWFITTIAITKPAALTTDIILVNFRVSSWLDDAVVPSSAGKLFFPAGQGGLGADTFYAEFFGAAVFLGFENLPVPLRLVGGDYLTLVATLTGAVIAAAQTTTLTAYGYKARLLGV